MQIVIDIPEMAYNLLKSDATIDWLDAYSILDRIVEGIILPKGHGRLIDADRLVKKAYKEGLPFVECSQNLV